MEVVAVDAQVARHLAAARDLADLGVEVEANRTVVNASGQQLNARVAGLEDRVDLHLARSD